MMMTATVDQQNNQILSPLCSNCPEPYFKKAHPDLPNAGCCSYSPTFSLFELWKMVQKDERFVRRLFELPTAEVLETEVKVHAHVHEGYSDRDDLSSLSPIEQSDLIERYSVCVFLRNGKGCMLDASFKNAVCRSFICPSVEATLSNELLHEIQAAIHAIQHEAKQFHTTCKQVLQELGLSLKKDHDEVIRFLKQYYPEPDLHEKRS